MTRFEMTPEGAHGWSRERRGQGRVAVWARGDDPRSPAPAPQRVFCTEKPTSAPDSPVRSIILLLVCVVGWR